MNHLTYYVNRLFQAHDLPAPLANAIFYEDRHYIIDFEDRRVFVSRASTKDELRAAILVLRGIA